jgi:hypothetical protein
MGDVEAQCRWSAALLATNIARLGLSEGVRAYNGSGPAARAYRDDVLERMASLEANYFAFPTAAPPRPQEVSMFIYFKGVTGFLYDGAREAGRRHIAISGAVKNALENGGKAVPVIPGDMMAIAGGPEFVAELEK